MLKDPQTRRVVFFASPKTGDDKDMSIDVVNLPVLAALVAYEVGQVIELATVLTVSFLPWREHPDTGRSKAFWMLPWQVAK